MISTAPNSVSLIPLVISTYALRPIPSCFASRCGGAPPAPRAARRNPLARARGRARRVVAAVVVRSGRGLVRERVRGDEVPAPDLGRIERDLGGEHVHRALDHLRRLGPAGAADRAGRGRVRDDRRDVDLDLRDRVDAARHHRGQVGEERADAGIGAGVLEDVEPQRRHPTVAVAAELELDPLRPSLVHRDEVLAARLGPAHRPPGGARQRGDDHVLDLQPLAAEPTADVRRHDAHLARLQPEQQAEHHLVRVRCLRRQPDRQAAVVAELRERRPRLHRAGGQSLADTVDPARPPRSRRTAADRARPARAGGRRSCPPPRTAGPRRAARSRCPSPRGSGSYSTSTSSAASTEPPATARARPRRCRRRTAPSRRRGRDGTSARRSRRTAAPG